MNCPTCGNANPDGCVLCSFCGNSLGSDQQEYQQASYQQPVFSRPVYNSTAYNQTPYNHNVVPGSDTDLEEPVSISEWLVSMLICCIPVAGFVMMLVWAFGGDSKKSKSNYFKASLIMSGIMLAIYLIFFVFIIILMF